MPSVLLYGSYGFVGNPVAREAIDRDDLESVLAGRDREQLRERVDDLERPGRRFALDDPDIVAEALEGVEGFFDESKPESGTPEVDVAG